MSDDVKKLWQRVYSMTQSQSRPKTWGSHISLAPKFDQDVLNDISKLNDATAEELPELINSIRGTIQVAATTGLVGEEDLEELQQLLDKISDREG